MNIFSAISIVAFVIYILIGIYAYRLEKQSNINKLFLYFCISMGIWSFAYAFVYVTQEEQYIWMKISAVGWCTFSSFILHLVLLFTENKLINKFFIKVLLYVPSVLFFSISVFGYWNNSLPPQFIQDFFNIGDFIYHFSFLLTGIILIAIWGVRSESIRKRKQAKIIVVSSLIPFLLNLLTQTVLPALGIVLLPLMGHIFSLVMIIGAYYAMIKYRLFTITPRLLVEELLQEMMDLVILIAPDGRIIRVNDYAEKLLGYSFNELYDKGLDVIVQKEIAEDVMKLSVNTAIHRFAQVNFIKKDGGRTPISMSCSLIIDPDIKDILGTIIVGQDISLVKQLEKEIAGHRKAQEHIMYLANHDSLTGLPNRKYFYEILNKAVENNIATSGNFAVLFLDMDDLKLVNDRFGHEAGDQLLREVGKRARTNISEDDIVARIGGDEITFLINDIKSTKEAAREADRILNVINQPIAVCGEEVSISASIGSSVFPYDGDNADMLVKKADNAMYAMKRKKKRQYAKAPNQ